LKILVSGQTEYRDKKGAAEFSTKRRPIGADDLTVGSTAPKLRQSPI
jgi:hypothetical protein